MSRIWDAPTNIAGVLHRPQIAPDIAKFTGLSLRNVCATLEEMEKDGRVRKNGQRAGWNGDLYDLWERVAAAR